MTLTAGGVGIAEPMPPSHEKKGVPYRHASRVTLQMALG